MKDIIAIAISTYACLVAVTFAGAALENTEETFFGTPIEEEVNVY